MAIEISSLPAAAAAIGAARRVDLRAYTLRAGPVRDALEAASRAGAQVRIRLERDPLDDAVGSLHAANAETVARLRAVGADAALSGPGEPTLHLKAALVDGVAWLDDRNWSGDGGETVVRDTDADDVSALGRALATGSGGDAHLASTKAGALALEARAIRAAGPAPLDVESESFGAGAISGALMRRAAAGAPTRLLVAGREARQAGPAGDRERRLLARLAAAGLAVRVGPGGTDDCDEKLVAGERWGWVGSANATYARGAAGRQADWGMLVGAPPVLAGIRAAFAANWARAQDWPAGGP